MSEHTPVPWIIFVDNSSGRDRFDILSAMRAGEVARDIGKEADAYLIAAAPLLLEALMSVRRLISEAAMTGFNRHDGNWAARLYASQGATSHAIAKACGNSVSKGIGQETT